ncbi:unnamed protein product [Linum trigynum]|uniref:Uncharacterized protein n=1 Tax=Linum trigynum TaxID=586398 RepID=A0AAV2F5J1_9ROSI
MKFDEMALCLVAKTKGRLLFVGIDSVGDTGEIDRLALLRSHRTSPRSWVNPPRRRLILEEDSEDEFHVNEVPMHARAAGGSTYHRPSDSKKKGQRLGEHSPSEKNDMRVGDRGRMPPTLAADSKLKRVGTKARPR